MLYGINNYYKIYGGEQMQPSLSISAAKILLFLDNLNINNIINCTGVGSILLSSPDNRLSGIEANKIIEAAEGLTADNNIGLHQGEHLSKGFPNILGYVLLNCPTLKECWEKYCRYEKIADNTSISDFYIMDDYAVLSNSTVDETLKTNQQFTDFKIAGMVSYINLLTNQRFKLKEVHFTYQKPQNICEYERIFGCKICFGKPANSLIFDRKFLDIPVVAPNENLLLMFEKNAQEIMDSLNNKNTYSSAVTKIILSDVTNCSFPSINTIAKKLLLSARSLQLYLHKENTTYSKLLKDIRISIAKKYLTNNTISIDEITYLLGFSENSAFNRAFKKWTGLTPSQFRKSVQCHN